MACFWSENNGTIWGIPSSVHPVQTNHTITIENNFGYDEGGDFHSGS